YNDEGRAGETFRRRRCRRRGTASVAMHRGCALELRVDTGGDGGEGQEDRGARGNRRTAAEHLHDGNGGEQREHAAGAAASRGWHVQGRCEGDLREATRRTASIEGQEG